jgi:hypothetical protein
MRQAWDMVFLASWWWFAACWGAGAGHAAAQSPAASPPLTAFPMDEEVRLQHRIAELRAGERDLRSEDRALTRRGAR